MLEGGRGLSLQINDRTKLSLSIEKGGLGDTGQ